MNIIEFLNSTKKFSKENHRLIRKVKILTMKSKNIYLACFMHKCHQHLNVYFSSNYKYLKFFGIMPAFNRIN